MQSLLEQQKANMTRLAAYRAKQTEQQRRRAKLADNVKCYCKKLGLNIPQSIAAISIAIKQFDHGCTAELAYEFGASTARIIALVNAGQQLSDIIQRKARVLH
ncbi:MAG: hypothetical protein ACXV8O_05020 [Methylobacter sp.]